MVTVTRCEPGISWCRSRWSCLFLKNCFCHYHALHHFWLFGYPWKRSSSTNSYFRLKYMVFSVLIWKYMSTLILLSPIYVADWRWGELRTELHVNICLYPVHMKRGQKRLPHISINSSFRTKNKSTIEHVKLYPKTGSLLSTLHNMLNSTKGSIIFTDWSGLPHLLVSIWLSFLL